MTVTVCLFDCNSVIVRFSENYIYIAQTQLLDNNDCEKLGRA